MRMKTANAYLHAINASSGRHFNAWIRYHQKCHQAENNIYKALNFWSKRLTSMALKHWQAHHEICNHERDDEKLAFQARQSDLAKSTVEHWLKVGIKFSEISAQENYAKMQSQKAKEIGLAYKFGMRWLKKTRANSDQRRQILSPYKSKDSIYSRSPVQNRATPNKQSRVVPERKSPMSSSYITPVVETPTRLRPQPRRLDRYESPIPGPKDRISEIEAQLLSFQSRKQQLRELELQVYEHPSLERSTQLLRQQLNDDLPRMRSLQQEIQDLRL